MPLVKCANPKCSTHFNAPDPGASLQFTRGQVASNLTFVHLVTKCPHCLQDYVVVLGDVNPAALKFSLLPIAPPNGVATPAPPDIVIARG